MDYISPPGSPVHEIFQARILEWKSPCPSPRDRPNPGIEPMSTALAGKFFAAEPPGKPLNNIDTRLFRREQSEAGPGLSSQVQAAQVQALG